MELTITQPAKTRLDPERWLEQYGDYLYGYALSRLREPEVAEELVQETLLAALTGRERFAGQCSERTWLISILKHKVIDHFRRMTRERLFDTLESHISDTEEAFHTDGAWKGHWRTAEGFAPADWGSNPETELESQEFWRMFERCLSELPPRLAQVFMLREVDAYTSEEICDLIDITPNNLWVMLHRARLQLRRSLELQWFSGRTVHTTT